MSDVPKLLVHFFRLSLSVVVLLIASSLHAQSSAQSVTSGSEKTLLETKQAIKVTKDPQRGSARIESTGTGADQINKLIYKANDSATKVTDSLEYTLDGAQPTQRMSIDIQPKSETPPNTGEEQSPVLKALLLLFTLAVVLESALALVFNWRPFVETFNSRAVRPIVSFLVAYLFVEIFRLDLVTTIVNASDSGMRLPGTAGRVLTAMVLAGGSAAVNNVLVGLGFRQKRAPETLTPKPPPDKGWISVRVIRQNVAGPVDVFIGPPPTAPATHPPLATVIRGISNPKWRYFLNDRGRFPGSGGYTVKAGDEIRVDVVGLDQSNQPVTKTWGPYKIAGDAIIDLEF
jgi:hypothetical protein